MVTPVAIQTCPGILVAHIGVFIQLMNSVTRSDSTFEEKNDYIKQQ